MAPESRDRAVADGQRGDAGGHVGYGFHFSSLDEERRARCVQSALRKYPRGGDPTYSAPGAAKMRQAAGRSLVHSILMPRHSHTDGYGPRGSGLLFSYGVTRTGRTVGPVSTSARPRYASGWKPLLRSIQRASQITEAPSSTKARSSISSASKLRSAMGMVATA